MRKSEGSPTCVHQVQPTVAIFISDEVFKVLAKGQLEIHLIEASIPQPGIKPGHSWKLL